MRQSPLFSGILYIILGSLFTIFAIQNVQEHGGWHLFAFILVILATIDFGSGIRMINVHFKIKKIQSKK